MVYTSIRVFEESPEGSYTDNFPPLFSFGLEFPFAASVIFLFFFFFFLFTEHTQVTPGLPMLQMLYGSKPFRLKFLFGSVQN